MSDDADPPDEVERTEPPPFDPDPDLIAYLETKGKPTPEEARRTMEPRERILRRLRERFSRAGSGLSRELAADREREAQRDD